MRPVRLILSAFGPYAATEVIDFRLLGDRSFFLIHGPTGAGKSTILDAIAFALYGETSGGERQAAQMRSGHADPDLPTEVTLDFALGGETYRVTRNPEQERPRKRGGGTTVQRPAATLWRRTGLADDGEEGTVLAAQWSRVTEEIQRIVGFRSDQFRQVVMLPQGQFRRFLISDSRGREEILEVLFQTEVYKRIQDALKEEARQARARFDDLAGQKRIVLEQASVASEQELAANRAELASRMAEAAARLEELTTAEKAAGERLNQARSDALKLAELALAESAVQAAEGGKNRIEADAARLDRARKAAGLEDVEAHCLSRERELQSILTGLGVAEKKLAEALRAKESATGALAAEEGRENQREEARRDLDRLREMVSGVRELQKARESRERSRRRAGRISGLAGDRRAGIEKLRRGLEADRRQLTGLGEAARKIEPLRMELQRVERLHAQAVLLKSKSSALDLAAKQAQQSEEAWKRIGKEFAEAREALDSLERDWLEGQAAVLAGCLAEGAPCPVCGSLEHPAPARSDRKLPDAAAVKKARKTAQALEKQLEERRREHDVRRTEALTIETEVKGLRRNLEEEGCGDPEALEKALGETRRLLQDAERAQGKAGALEKKIAALAAEEASFVLRCGRLEKGLGEAEARAKAAEAVAAEREGRVPEAMRDPAALQLAIARGEAKWKQFAAALELARKKHETSIGAVASCEGTLLAARTAADTARTSLQAAREQFAARLQAAGFTDGSAYLAAKLDPESVETLDRAIRAFHVELAAAKERLDRAREAAPAPPAPDVSIIERQVEEIRSALKAVIAEKASLGERIGQADLRLRDLRGISKEMEEAERRYAVAGKLSDVANGKNSQGISFQRFVLASFLDDVLGAASKRLRRMSKGRYDLERARERESLRSAGGLDLLVFDTYTGTARPVNTLSGGESFLASLALALGLVDVVQAHAGGTKLETIFVDEGFGSLDPEALDLAFETLLDLREGHRLVGIISH
ncbi:MAG: SMC family ATPase, partial [Syntrophobacteraceae bacterium]